MQSLYFPVIPAKAGIQWLPELRHPRFRGDDGKQVFFDTLLRERARMRVESVF